MQCLKSYIKQLYRLIAYYNTRYIRPDTSRRQRRQLPPLPLVIALVPVKCHSRNLQSPHIGCPLPRRKCLGPLALSKTKHTGLGGSEGNASFASVLVSDLHSVHGFLKEFGYFLSTQNTNVHRCKLN